MRGKKIAAFILCAVFLACCIPLTIRAATAGNNPVVKGHTVSLSGSIDLNYYLRLPAQYTNKNTKAVFTWGDKTVEAGLVSIDKNNSNYLVQCNLPCTCMTEMVTMKLVDGNNRAILTENYSVVEYLDSLALKYRDTTDNHDKYLQRLLEALLIYGGSAQQHYSYRTDDTADSDVYMRNVMTDVGNRKMGEVVDAFVEDAPGIINELIWDIDGYSIKDIEEDDVGIKFRGTSIKYDDATSLRLLFDVTDSTKANALTAWYNDKKIAFGQQDGALYLEIKGMFPDLFYYGEIAIKINDKVYKYMPLDLLAQSVSASDDMEDMSCAVYAYGYFLKMYVDNQETAMPDNGIPVVYLRIDESQGTIDDMIDSPDHSVYCYGTMSIDVPEGFHYCDFPDNVCQSVSNLSMSIRGRGNSTWAEPGKKPFKIKLDKKADLFGLGANKHWVLVANKLDSSLIKDRITAWLGDQMGFEFTPRGVPVDVVIVGGEYGTQYIGSYYLSENVRVDSNRLDIDELDADDVDPQTITGGYLLQNGSQVSTTSPDRFFTSRGALWSTHTPSFDTSENGSFTIDANRLGATRAFEDTFADPELGDGYVNPAQQQYIQNHIQHVEDVMYEGGTAYRELMDVESAAKYWLVQAFCLNSDGYATGSTYIYKERDQGSTVGKIYWGPLWDFDYAWTYNYTVTGFPVDAIWIKPLICDRTEGGFVPEVLEQWDDMKPYIEELIADGGIIDQYYEETRLSAEADHEIYSTSSDDDTFSYREKVDDLKTWIRNRLNWVDANIGELGDYMHRIEFLVDGDVYYVNYLNNRDYISPLDVPHPAKDGLTFVGWKDEDGNFFTEDSSFTRDTTFEAVYVPDSEVTHAEDIVFEEDHVTVVHNVHISYYQIQYTVLPEDAIDKEVLWSSSDEDYATVNEYGYVHYNGVGEVTITATLKNGVSRDFVLTVVPPEETD